jgi:hypothetical protein
LKAFFKTRYDASHETGREKLLSGNIPLFAGVQEAMKGEMMVAVKLKELGHRFFVILAQLGGLESSGYRFFLADRDFPTHSTVQVSVDGHEACSELMAGQDFIKTNTLSFNRLVLDGGGNIVLMNEEVPDEISHWRGWASQVMTEHGGQPKPLPIFHATVARIISFNNEKLAAEKLVSLVEKWNQELQEFPLLFISKGTYVGTVYDLLQPVELT